MSLFIDILSALGDVEVRETYILDEENPEDFWVRGTMSDDGVLCVNPVPDVVEILVHELIHHVRPDWAENTVRQQTGKLLRTLKHKDLLALYRQYLKRRTITGKEVAGIAAGQSRSRVRRKG